MAVVDVWWHRCKEPDVTSNLEPIDVRVIRLIDELDYHLDRLERAAERSIDDGDRGS